MRYEITDFESGGKKTIIEGPGVVETMFEYLPWPYLNLRIRYMATNGLAEVTDLETDFRYELVLQ